MNRTTESVIDLDGKWKMKDFTSGIGVQKKIYLPENEPADCLPCQVPGTVRTALLQAGEIPDPYFGYNNEKSLWVEQKEWWFFKKFSVPAGLEGKFIDLDFEGTSFQGEFWINGQKAGELKGMLNPRSFDVSRLLKYGAENQVVVRLEAPPDEWSKTMEDGLTWRAPRDQLYSIAQCMYGWDWGPHGLPIGLWKSVSLHVTGPVRIENPYVVTKVKSSKKAVCNVRIEVRNLTADSIDARIVGQVKEKKSNRIASDFEKTVKLKSKETRKMIFDVAVTDPQLWWPNGMGDQNLYILDVAVAERDSESDNLSTQFGIRELKLVDNERVGEFLKSMQNDVGDPHHLGNAVGSYPWTFLVNGRKMFAKGGNWIPDDQLLRLDHSRYERLLKLFKDGNFNLLRVWGGGLYETDDFYNLCDEYGILTWQEFLSNQNFSKIDRDNFLEGAKSAVLSLRNHPSLTFWCGGNEFDPDDVGSKTVIDSLAALLKTFDPVREFHRASPYMGDDHYWGVWHGLEPYTKYRVVRPFRSEAGLNAPPVFENYVKFTPAQFLWPPDTTYIEYHGESGTGFTHLSKLMRYVDEFGDPSCIEELITHGQLYQALGNEFDMEFCRSNKFRNSGFLVWQYDDIWPCLSWSIVDWYGTPKPSYYFLKRASRPVHISADYERYLWNPGETFKSDIYLLNDTEDSLKGLNFRATLLDCSGRTLAEKSGSAGTSANTSKKIGEIKYRIPESMKGKSFFVVVELEKKSGGKISDAIYPIAVSNSGELSDYKNIFSDLNNMPKVHLSAKSGSLEVSKDSSWIAAGEIQLTNPDSSLAFFVRIRMVEESDTLRSSYSDNYISLVGGETKTISVRIEHDGKMVPPPQLHFEISGLNCQIQELKMDVNGI